MKMAELVEDIDIINLHATGTTQGDIRECAGIRGFIGDRQEKVLTPLKVLLVIVWVLQGHRTEGNLPSFEMVWPCCYGIDELDPDCEIPGLVIEGPIQESSIIESNSFGMLGINSTLI